MSSGSISKAILIGNVTREPVIKSTNTGKKVASFSVAVNRMKEGEADFHNVVAWEKLAEIVEKYVLKGTKVYVEGRLQNRSYEKDGVTKYITEIIATDLTLLGTKPTGTDAPTTPAPTIEPTPDAPVDDIDF